MAKTWSHKNRSGIDGRHRRLSDLFLLFLQEPRQLWELGLVHRKILKSEAPRVAGLQH